MKKALLSALSLVFASGLLLAQTNAEIAAARAMAQQYGYSSSEFDNFVYKKGNQTVGATVASQAPITIVDESSPVQVVQAVPQAPVDGPDEDMPGEIYGHSFFNSSGYGLIPASNAPVPDSFVLGAGDEVVIDIYGASTGSVAAIIGKDGKVNIPEVGPVSLAGMTVSKAEKALTSRLSNVYGGLQNGQTKLQLTVGKVKGVTVNVTGEVKVPGVYNLPSLASICSAIFMAGGVTERASVRVIRLYRGGRLAGTFDLYNFIFKGSYGDNLRLQENDVVSVAPYDKIVNISGSVLRPMKYEMKEGETLRDLIDFAGGFKNAAFSDMLHIERQLGATGSSYDVRKEDFGTFRLERGDRVSVATAALKFGNRVSVSGAVTFAGDFSISDKLQTVSDLVKAAGGLQEGAYVESAYIRRLDENLNPVVVPVNLSAALDGTADVKLVRGDRLYIIAGEDMNRTSTVSITGEVHNPGTFDYGNGMTLRDIILMAEGFEPGAAVESIEISRRGLEKEGEVINVDLKADASAYATPLMPFDKVYVRRYVHYKDQVSVLVSGEVMFPGTYAIENASVRLSDVISRAGGVTKDAYVKGAKLVRHLTEEEYERMRTALEVAMKQTNNRDSVAIDVRQIGQEFSIAIDLEKALADKGSYYDVVLRSGDEIVVPLFNNTVKISGGVAYPNTVTFNKDFSLNDYISEAGGYVKSARKQKVYAVYMNGSAAVKGSRLFRLEPGMEIVVPQAEEREVRPMTAAEIASLATSTSSLAYMITAMINLLKR